MLRKLINQIARASHYRGLTVTALPGLVGLVVAGAALLLWWQLHRHDGTQIRRTLNSEADSAKREIQGRVETRLFNLVRMAERWELRRSIPRVEWESDAALLVEQFPEMSAVVWIDATFRVQWVAPTGGERPWVGVDLGNDPTRRAALEKARNQRTIQIMGGLALKGEPQLILAVAPIFIDDEFGGFIGGIFRSQPMLQTVLANVAEGLSISVREGPDVIFLRNAADRILDGEWGVETDVTLAGAHWRLGVWPSQEWLATVESQVDEVALVGGLILALLLSLTLHFAQIATLRSRELAHEAAERKVAQEKAEFLAAIVNSSGDAIIGQTSDGVILSWNTGAERLYGYSTPEMIGRSISELLPPNHPDDLHEILKTTCHSRLIDHCETVGVRKDGTLVQISVTASPIRDARGTVVGASLIARDISLRKRAEAEIKRTLERLEQSVRDQSLSLASTSHDIRGALAAIAGYGELLSEEVTADGAQEMALRIVSLAHTLADVMTDLLQYANGQANTPLVPKPVSVRTLIERSVKDWRSQCAQKGLALRVDLPDDALVVLDSGQVTRILHNLISNAIRYTPRGEIRVRGELGPTDLRVVIEDTGIGIASEDIERIFDEFYRTEEAKKLENLGTGLGLATVKRLVKLLGGHVHVRSVVGAGTTFEVILPRQPSD